MAGIEKFKGFISIMRPHLAIMTLTLAGVVGLLATYSTVQRFPEIWLFILVVLATYFAVVGSYVFNDYRDVDIDSINFPDRAIPAAQLRQKDALGFSLVLYGISCVIFAFLSIYALIVVIIAIIVITIYSTVMKRKTFLSFLPVGIAYGLVPLGVWLAFTSTVSWIPVLFSLMICITDWGFTNSDASRDVHADKEKGAPTFPVTYGIPATTRLILTSWTVGVLLSLLIWYTAKLSHMFLIVAIASGIWMLVKAYDFYKHPEPEVGGRVFLQASKYRGVLFFGMIVDVCLLLVGVRLDLPV